jgi:hypothetical protein
MHWLESYPMWNITRTASREQTLPGSSSHPTCGLSSKVAMRCCPGTRSTGFRVASSTPRVVRAFDEVDDLLGRILPFLCTNHYFVATKPTSN